MIRALLTSLALLATTAAARADDDCFSKGSQAEMTACAAAALKQSDARLNKMYAQIRHRLADDADATKLLTAAQRAWVTYRDAECAFQASASQGGTVHGLAVALCQDQVTSTRIKAFDGYLHCKEGDITCPVPAR